MSARPEATIVDLLSAKLAALVFSPAIPIAWPHVPFTPPASPRLWLEAWPMFNTTGNLFLGNGDPSLHLGIMQVTVVSPLGEGATPALGIAEQVAAHFAKGTRLQSEDVDLRIYEKPSISTPFKDEGDLRTAVSIRWRVVI
ncbi:DUF4128 domain-containing protein [Xanthobacter tagetidis]|uniref:DUF3168 domain-containing protein n=1 Tax=Xanthobacter tagetidis TaxID=60216 RepID=A0A3L7AJ86_9HYPH|nr:DUF4128 domain-containing protein [Xanthobacter tagetidis]MBB6306220.1 hypothetical protein [Xanthobacter tagetidis]RLP79502.1 hypothetical protein D9R14_07505 [Xanthobacter tagetidis]